MFRKIFSILFVAATFTALCATAQAQATKPATSPADLVINPQYDSWCSPKFKVGTAVRYKALTISGIIKTPSEITNTIKASSHDKIILTIKTISTVMDMKDPIESSEDQEIHSMIARADLPQNSPNRKLLGSGEEDVKTADKIYKCSWEEYENVVKTGGRGIVCRNKVWTCRDVPGGLVKMEASTLDEDGKPATQIKMTLVEVKIAE